MKLVSVYWSEDRDVSYYELSDEDYKALLRLEGDKYAQSDFIIDNGTSFDPDPPIVDAGFEF